MTHLHSTSVKARGPVSAPRATTARLHHLSNCPVSLCLAALLLTAPLHAQQQAPTPHADILAKAIRLPMPISEPPAATSTSTPPPAAATAATSLTLATAVTVKADANRPLEPQAVSTHTFTGTQVLQSAGTFGDLPRYLQTLPGLIGGSDAQNASFVRGGNSFENLYVMDRIEVPNINHFALANSTGGLGSMLDTEFIAGVTFHSGDMSSAFESHISSVTEIRTLELPEKPVYSVDLGYTGGGFRINRPLGPNRAFMFSARESVTSLFGNDVGLNGSPKFTNSFSKYTWDVSSRDHLWVEALSGIDALAIKPTWNDNAETNAFDTNYSGWRNTTGLVWQHTHESDAISTWTVSNSQDVQRLTQRDQMNADALLFRQNDSEGRTNLKYQFLKATTDGSSREAGVDVHLNRISYDVAQPSGVFSPYSGLLTPQGAFAAAPNFHTIDQAAYLESTTNIRKHFVLRAGIRLAKFGYSYGAITGPVAMTTATAVGGTIPSIPAPTDNAAFLPHASLSVLATHSLNFRVSWAKYAELPPYATIASQPQNAYLGLIHSQQAIAGATLRINRFWSADVEAYRKLYTGYPVSTLYSQVSLASILPTIYEPFSLLSMTSNGKGRAQGVELSVKQEPWHHFFTQANVSYSRAMFTGTDGVYRSGSNDLPIVANVMAGISIKKMLITVRDTAASGRPYTPFLQLASERQDRGIFDLSQLNALRGSMYNRLDVAVNREFMVHGRVMRVHAGALNVLNRKNFFENLWHPRTGEYAAEPSMGFEPDFGMGYTF